jgi:anti-sigma factor RsiW
MYNYSPEELIQYLYNETSPTTTAAIEKALKQDWTLREKLAVLKTSMERLNSITQSPRTETILAILKYAAKPQTVSTN